MEQTGTKERRTRWARRISRIFMKNAFPGSRRIGRFFSDLLLPRPMNSEVVHTPFGYSLRVEPLAGGVVDAVLYRDGVYEIGTLDVARSLLRNGDVAVDAGAHIGLFSLAAAALVGDRGRVFAFEPGSESFHVLEGNIALNGFRNVTALRQALGSRSEVRDLFHPLPPDRALASLVEPDQWTEREVVTVAALDAILSSRNISSVAMLKIDAEGWEAEILTGARSLLSRDEGPVVSVEFDRSDPAGAGIFDFLKSINRYRVFRRKRGKGSVSPFIEIRTAAEIPERDNLYAFLPAHRFPGR